MNPFSVRWAMKRLRQQVTDMRRELDSLRQGHDVKRWPRLVTELQEAQRDARAAREALVKMKRERDACPACSSRQAAAR